MKRALVGLGAACLLAVCITGIVLVARLLHQQAATREFIAAGPAHLAREEAAARQAGIPLTASELQRPLPPPGQNAAPLYMKLTKLLHDKPLGLPKYAEGIDAFHSYTPAQVAAVRRTLAARQDVMTLVHQAADRPRCVFVRDWKKGAKLEFPEYLPMREAARLVETESYLLARDGRCQEAIINQARGFRVAEHAASDHLLLAYLVGVASESITLSGMQSILALAGPDTGIDADVRQAVEAKRSRLSLRVAMAGEVGFVCLAFERMHRSEKYGVQEVMRVGGLSTDKATSKKLVTRMEQARVHNLIDAWQADLLGRMRQVVRACDLPIAPRREVFAALGQQPESPRPAESENLASYVVLPIYSPVDQNDTRTRAREVITCAAAALLHEKTKTGAYPGTLPPGFADSFTDKPLLYRREGGGRQGEKVPAQESLFRYPAVPIPPD